MGWLGWVITFASFIVVINVLAALIGCVLAKILTQPAKPTEEELVLRLIEREGSDYSELDNFEKEDFLLFSMGIEIRGTVYFADKKSTNWVIISHGYTASRISSYKYMKDFLSFGYNCVVYDQRYFGSSGGEFCSMGYFEQQDLLNVINYIKDKYGDDIFLALHGESMGAVCSLVVLNLTDKVDCVIADCPFADAKKYFAQKTKEMTHFPIAFPIFNYAHMRIKSHFKFDLYAVSPVKAVEKTDVPILFIHGVADSQIDRSNSIELYDKCKNPNSRIVLFPDAEHALSHMKDGQKYREAVKKFVDEAEKNKIENVRKNDG